MKKFFAFLMCMAMVFSIAVVAQAASNPYEVEKLGMSLEIPDTFEVVTESEDQNTYLVANAKEGDAKITVTMVASDAADLQEMNRKEQTQVASAMYSVYEEQGLTVSKYNLYNNKTTTFIRAFYNNADKTLCGLKYYTVLGGKQYEIILEKNGEIVTDDELMMREVVDSAVFGAKAETAGNTDSTEAAGETKADKTAETDTQGKSNLVLPISIGCGVLVLIVVVVVVLKKKGSKD